MATIFTVHGTGASGDEEGSMWWQRGSPFEKDLRQLVESEDGTLTFRPLIWGGLNSEQSRRNASALIYEAASQMEKGQEKYCIVGHSHGGTAISGALLLAASKGQALPNLVRWISIGTPFIENRRALLLFSRLGVSGKSAYLSILVTVCVLLVFAFIEHKGSRYENNLIFTGIILLSLLSPYIFFYLLSYLLVTKSDFGYRHKTKLFADSAFFKRWFPLVHPNDEAIAGLRAAKEIRVPFFQTDFAVSSLIFCSLFTAPAIILFMATSETLMMQLCDRYPPTFGRSRLDGDDCLRGNGNDFLVNIYFLFNLLEGSLFRVLGVDQVSWFGLLFVATGMPFLIYLFSLIIIFGAGYLSKPVSYLLSRYLNLMTWRQIRRMAFGTDVVGELPSNIFTRPPWTNRSISTLPQELSEEIERHSDGGAAAALPQLRHAVLQLALSKDRDARDIFFLEYLTWDWLIHCSYFGVPSFCKLLAYSIAHSPGFRATPAFVNDPDYKVVGQWYKEIAAA